MFLFLKTLSGACHRKLYFSGKNLNYISVENATKWEILLAVS